MRCPDIEQIQFSQTSIDAIEDIRSRQQLSNLLLISFSAGTIINIFIGNGALESSYNIYSTDFKLLVQAMSSVPALTRDRISFIAGDTLLRVSDRKEIQFWQAVREGCSMGPR